MVAAAKLSKYLLLQPHIASSLQCRLRCFPVVNFTQRKHHTAQEARLPAIIDYRSTCCLCSTFPHLGDLAEGEAQRLRHAPVCREHRPHLLAFLQPPLEPREAPLEAVQLGCVPAHAEDGLVHRHLALAQPVHELVAHLAADCNKTWVDCGDLVDSVLRCGATEGWSLRFKASSAVWLRAPANSGSTCRTLAHAYATLQAHYPCGLCNFSQMASNATAAHLWSECVDHQACICQAFDVVWRELHVAAAQQHLEVVQHSITQPILQRQREMNKGCEGRRTEDQEYIDVSSSSSGSCCGAQGTQCRRCARTSRQHVPYGNAANLANIIDD